MRRWTTALITYPCESTYSACIFCMRCRHTSCRKPLEGFFCVGVPLPLRHPRLLLSWPRITEASSCCCWMIFSALIADKRANSGNHFQLPSSDYFGTAACHCEMGLGFTVAKKKAPITAFSCLLIAGMY